MVKVSCLFSPDFGMHFTISSKYKESKDYICRVAQIILRERIEIFSNIRNRTKSDTLENIRTLHNRTKSEPTGFREFQLRNSVDILSLAIDEEFWNSSVALHLDIVTNGGIVLERWILNFSLNKFTSDDGVPANLNSLQERNINYRDFTEWKLLLQSLYTKLRGFPVSVSLLNGDLQKTQLKYSITSANGNHIPHISNISAHVFEEAREFDTDGSIDVYKFKTSVGPIGSLSISVVYDSKLGKLESPNSLSVDLVNLDVALKTTEYVADNDGNGSVIISGSFPDTEEQKLESSPFPSPKMRKKVLSLNSKHMEHEQNVNSGNRTSQNRPRRSNLYICITRSSSVSSQDSVCSGKNSDVQDSKILNSDGVEVQNDYFYPVKENQRIIVRRESPNSDFNGSFIGSYEESILIGRLSTSPSKPLHFIADIGVLGTSKCKSSLKCPPHLLVSFPAYFYQLPGEDFPTPYVGTVDFENENSTMETSLEHQSKLEDGCYRLPPKGQLQIVSCFVNPKMIKNQKSNAIKVFLVPYDFRDMPINSKTFLRQKSYCIPKNPISPSHDDRLRFAIHLNFCMNSKKHLLLMSAIRVVFSPRPIETDETLKIVYQGPNSPKYIPTSPVSSHCTPCVPALQDQGR